MAKRIPHNKIIYSKEELQKILNFYQLHTKKETMLKFHISAKVIDRILKENNISHHSKKIITAQEEAEICKLYEEHTSAYIGRIFHIHAERVNKIILSHGKQLHSCQINKEFKVKDFKKTMISRYGVDNPNKCKEIKQRTFQTNLKKYGVICPSNTKESKASQALNREKIIKKRKKTCMEKYGTEEYTHTKQYWESRKKTCLKKYGAEEWTKSKYFYQSFPGKFWCDGVSFDSLPELSIYLYFVYHNLEIQRPKTTFIYSSIDGNHVYHPDFKIDGKLIEVKGDHFFKDGSLINPYSQDEKEQQIAKDKWKCMMKNNIEIWTKKKYYKYVEWFISLGISKEKFRDKTSKSDIIRRMYEK